MKIKFKKVIWYFLTLLFVLIIYFTYLANWVIPTNRMHISGALNQIAEKHAHGNEFISGKVEMMATYGSNTIDKTHNIPPKILNAYKELIQPIHAEGNLNEGIQYDSIHYIFEREGSIGNYCLPEYKTFVSMEYKVNLINEKIEVEKTCHSNKTAYISPVTFPSVYGQCQPIDPNNEKYQACKKKFPLFSRRLWVHF